MAFDEPQETFHYLDMMRTTKGVRKPIRDILADESIPESFRRKSERAIYRQYVTIDASGQKTAFGAGPLRGADILFGADHHGGIPPVVSAASGEYRRGG